MKKLLIFLVIFTMFIGCGANDLPDTTTPISVETEDYFEFSWGLWEQSEDLESIWRLEGKVKNISDELLKNARVMAKFYDGDLLVNEMEYELGYFQPNTKEEFIVSSPQHPSTLTGGEIKIRFELEDIDNPHENEPIILNENDFNIEVEPTSF